MVSDHLEPFHRAADRADGNLASSRDEIIDDMKSKKLTCTPDTHATINDEEIKYYKKHTSTNGGVLPYA
jgi:hypothetical protein